MLRRSWILRRRIHVPILWDQLLRPRPFNSSSLDHFPARARQYANQRRPPQYNRFQQSQQLWRTSPEFRIVVVVAGGAITLWVGSNIEQVPISGRWRFNCISEAYEAELGRVEYEQTMQEYQGMITRPSDPRHQMVGRILRRLLPNSGLQGDLEYHVIDDEDEINAFVIPGGKVFVFSGIISMCKTEDGLAAVLGHELAHNVAHHIQENASLPYLITLVVGLVSLFFDNSAELTRFILKYGVKLPNSRVQEAEADHLGILVMMAQSCYNPEEAVHLWQRMDQASRSTVPQLLSTHPNSKNRIKRLQEWLPEAAQKRAASECGNISYYADQFHQAFDSYRGSGAPPNRTTNYDGDDSFW
ncbi:MAG: hypothetical protein Q9222_006887 [Ikaeria aurantiellina]